MTGKRKEALTDGQKECLRLVASHNTSKEIARKLNISHFTVDQRLDAARMKLNATSRKEAALLFVSQEGEALSEPFVYDARRIESSTTGRISNLSASSMGMKSSGNVYANYLSEENTSFPEKSFLHKIFSVVSVPPVGGQRHTLSTREIFLNSLNVAFYSAVIIGVIVIVIAGAMRLVK
jgi:DNA-binding CsgD family transcriptional regulator